MANNRLTNVYEAVGASASDQVLGSAGATGDKITTIVVQVTTSGANGTCSIKDGSGSAIPIVPASTPIGVHTVHFGKDGIVSAAGAWKVTTGSAATALVVGDFST